ncbi:hypothetical protein BKA81DRAFT_348618 [Phyllosticta paracitricarpa]
MPLRLTTVSASVSCGWLWVSARPGLFISLLCRRLSFPLHNARSTLKKVAVLKLTNSIITNRITCVCLVLASRLEGVGGKRLNGLLC